MANNGGKPAGAPRFALIAVVMAGILIVAASFLFVYALHENPKGAAGTLLGASIGGPFHLIDQDGRAFSDADLRGKWHLVFFGYTHCPDVCPTTLNEIALALDKLGKHARDDVGVVFVSVDPERDTPAVLKSYVQSFDAPITALSGSAAAVAEAAKVYHVYYAKHPRPDGGYDMDHSAVVYVMDPRGRFTATFTPDTTADAIAARLQKLLS